MKRFAALLALSLALAAPVVAAPVLNDSARGERLDQLFQNLKSAQSQSDALAAEQEISSIWLQSGDPSIDRQMQIAIQAMDGLYYDSALKVLSTIIVNRPDYVEAYNKRATLYYMVGNYQESLKDIDETLKLEPRHFGAIAGKGMVYLKLNQPQQALAAFKDALAVDPALSNIATEVQMLEAQLKGKGA
jgi:tetratricopeptide (TPR) repeat protein